MKGRRGEVKKRTETDSVDILPRYEKGLTEHLPNGYVAAYACGYIDYEERYINERMEQELENFKKELDRRYGRSRIT